MHCAPNMLLLTTNQINTSQRYYIALLCTTLMRCPFASNRHTIYSTFYRVMRRAIHRHRTEVANEKTRCCKLIRFIRHTTNAISMAKMHEAARLLCRVCKSLCVFALQFNCLTGDGPCFAVQIWGFAFVTRCCSGRSFFLPAACCPFISK